MSGPLRAALLLPLLGVLLSTVHWAEATNGPPLANKRLPLARYRPMTESARSSRRKR
jgi:hypothetical protein